MLYSAHLNKKMMKEIHNERNNCSQKVSFEDFTHILVKSGNSIPPENSYVHELKWGIEFLSM